MVRGNMPLSDDTQKILLAAGWQPDQDWRQTVEQWDIALQMSDGWEMFPAAAQALLKFGPLCVEQYAAGITRARETFELCPLLAMYDRERFEAYEEEAHTKLYPLGEYTGRRGQLAIGANGRVFGIIDDLYLVGEDIDDALNNLVEGHASQEL